MTIPLPTLDLQSLDADHVLRAFIGWWPDVQTRAWLAEQALQAHAIYGGRMMQPDHFHLTLAFLDGSRVSDLQSLATQMAEWTVPQIRMNLTMRDVFEKPRVVWAGPDQTQTQALIALQQWHEEIWAKLIALGWARQPRLFRPHVSLLRRARITADQPHCHALPTQVFVGDGVGLIVSVPGEQRSQYHLAATTQPARTGA
ncbi:RNA 2',3'-cyclic phosphodiesterase [Alcaligenes faecalis]|uniref:RNA 2',3'-cyclic phosphodiesterase n=1 Tax=Alcaligenes faecalis TaxID=511 RepID=UPI002932B6CB|nr:RNA 2',3'-cyclic phosphodiesterase [Alcaligenes faecalis]MDV2116112.1 RNA 2',3'-cyclic phosphodiesterase [Alcaligenes faecalis]